jgi:hypothetical protein
MSNARLRIPFCHHSFVDPWVAGFHTFDGLIHKPQALAGRLMYIVRNSLAIGEPDRG